MWKYNILASRTPKLSNEHRYQRSTAACFKCAFLVKRRQNSDLLTKQQVGILSSPDKKLRSSLDKLRCDLGARFFSWFVSRLHDVFNGEKQTNSFCLWLEIKSTLIIILINIGIKRLLVIFQKSLQSPSAGPLERHLNSRFRFIIQIVNLRWRTLIFSRRFFPLVQKFVSCQPTECAANLRNLKRLTKILHHL